MVLHSPFSSPRTLHPISHRNNICASASWTGRLTGADIHQVSNMCFSTSWTFKILLPLIIPKWKLLNCFSHFIVMRLHEEGGTCSQWNNRWMQSWALLYLVLIFALDVEKYGNQSIMYVSGSSWENNGFYYSR